MRYVFAAAALLLGSVPAAAQVVATGSYGVTLTTTPAQVTLPRTQPPQYLRIVNPGASGSAWCTRAGTTPAANAAGSYEIPSGGSEEFRSPSYVPSLSTWCVAASGTVPLTVEIR